MTALSVDTILIGGDFNVPAIKWLGQWIEFVGELRISGYCDYALDFIHLFSYQHVLIVFKTFYWIIDHKNSCCWYRHAFFCPRDTRFVSQNVFLYNEWDCNDVSSALHVSYERFTRMLGNSDRNTLWKAFKFRSHDAVTHFIPCKSSRNLRKFHKPWTGKEWLQRLIKKRKRAFLKHKEQKSNDYKKKLKQGSQL